MPKISQYSHFKEICSKFENDLKNEEKFIAEIKKNGLDASSQIECLFPNNIVERVEYFHKNNKISEFYRENIKLERINLLHKICELILRDDFDLNLSKIEKLNLGIVTSLAILVEGVSSSPEEGFLKAEEYKENDKIFIRLCFGPAIRGAGGTAQGAIVIIADWLRRKLGYDDYFVLDEEISRYTLEIYAYAKIHPRQRLPTSDEMKFIMTNLPIFIDGSPSEQIEVSSYKFTKRIKTARLRGGVCLIITEGLLLKYKKLEKYYQIFDLVKEWSWLAQLAPTYETNEKGSTEAKYLQSIIAGRPLFSMTNSPGHLRISVGRSFNTGLGTAGVHPMVAKLSKFLNVGTQLIIDSPGKALTIASVDTLAPPTVKLKNGDTVLLESPQIYYKVKDSIILILDYGEILISAGDFNQNKVPIPDLEISNNMYIFYCKKYNIIPDIDVLNEEKVFHECALYNIPPPSRVTPLFYGGTVKDFLILKNNFNIEKPISNEILQALDNFAILYTLQKKENHNYVKFKFPLFFQSFMETSCLENDNMQNLISKCKLNFKSKGKNTIGVRMGRAEGSSQTKTDPAVHWLVYSKDILASKHSLQKWMEDKDCIIKMRHIMFKCHICGICTIYSNHCGAKGERIAVLKQRNSEVLEYLTYNENKKSKLLSEKAFNESVIGKNIDIKQRVISGLRNMNTILDQNIKVGAGTEQKNFFLESFTKGYLRSKYNLFCTRDSTVRYTVSNSILTHASCKIINIDISLVKKLGYTVDIFGNKLETIDQIFELFPQDIVINHECAEYFLNVTKYLDDLLEIDYKSKKFYNCETIYDLIGLNFLGISPHTCVGIASRLIGFSNSNVLFAHYIFHTAKRRNADGDGDNIMLYLDCLLNFSYSYLKHGAGAKMNVPIFISRILDYNEIDDEAFSVDNYFYYSDEFIKNPKIKIENFEDIKNFKESHFKFSDYTSNINAYDQQNSYKDLKVMREKIDLQLKFLKLLRGTDSKNVVEKIISNHLLPDMIGCSRTFLRQNLKCEKCFRKFEFPPLDGFCHFCKSGLRLTIYPNSVRKYIRIMKDLEKEYQINGSFISSKIMLITEELDTIFLKQSNSLEDLFCN